MSSVYQIKLADLNPQLLQELQAQYGNTEVELHVSAPVRWSVEEENWFWVAIDRLDWSQESNDRRNEKLHHLYEIYDDQKQDTFKYGISANPIDDHGRSKRIYEQLWLFNR